MNLRRLGDTGLEVSEIGFGAWGIGGPASGVPAYGLTDDRESKLALNRAFELGVNFFDTSALYGDGHSERLIGDVFGAIRDQVVINTKGGTLGADGGQDFSPEYLRRSLEGSLKRLGTDYVDLFLLHSPPIGLFEDEPAVRTLLEAFKSEGKVRAFGVSVRSPGDGVTAVTQYGFKAIEVNFNMLDQRALEIGLFDLCADREVGVIIRTPLCFGFLTGAYSPTEEYGSADHRSTWSPAQIARWATAHELFSSSVASEDTLTPAQMALRFCLSYPSVSTAIPGMLTEEQVEENILASRMGSLPQKELERVQNIYQENIFFER